MQTIVGLGNNGRAVLSILKKLDFQYEVFDIDQTKSMLRRIEDVKGLIHICTKENAVEDLVKRINGAKDAKEIIIHSTMPMGWTRRIEGATSLPVSYMPMFFRENSPESDALSPNRIVFGISAARNYDMFWTFAEAYEEFAGLQAELFSFEAAELIKLATNSMRATSIEFFNLLYETAEKYGCSQVFKSRILQSELLKPSNVLDKWETKTGWGRNPELAGKAYGGLCLPKDAKYLSIRTRRIEE